MAQSNKKFFFLWLKSQKKNVPNHYLKAISNRQVNLIIFFMPHCSTIILAISKTKHRIVFWPMYSKSISSSVTCLNKYYLKESRQIYSSLLGFNLLCSMQGWKKISKQKNIEQKFLLWGIAQIIVGVWNCHSYCTQIHLLCTKYSLLCI